jgi:integrase
LGSLALEIIRSVPQVVGRDPLFGARTDRGFTSWAEHKKVLDRRLGDQVKPWTLHDLRRTVATGMADLEVAKHVTVAPHVIEEVLNHRSGHKRGVAGIYNRSRYEREVKAAVATWDRHIRDLIEGRDTRACLHTVFGAGFTLI